MPLSSEQIPNRPLSGSELKTYVLRVLESRLDSDCMFSTQIAYARVSFSVKVAFHLSPTVGDFDVDVYLRPDAAFPQVEGAPPLNLGPGEEHDVHSFEVVAEVDNPNLVRVHAGIPIEITAKIPPAPGDLFPHLETHQVDYDPADFPKPAEPITTDTSAKTAAALGVPQHFRKPAKDRGKYGADAVKTET